MRSSVHVKTVCLSLFLLSTCCLSQSIVLDGLYSFTQTVSLSDSKSPLGFRITGSLEVQQVHPSLVKMNVMTPTLLVMSKKSPQPDGFSKHKSEIETAQNGPFFIELSPSGEILNILVGSEENLSMVNLKKSLASAFQVQEGSREEVDASGECTVSYSSSPNQITKLKSKCKWSGSVSSTFWGAEISSDSHEVIQLKENKVERIIIQENYDIKPISSSNVASRINGDAIITRTGNALGSDEKFEGDLSSLTKDLMETLNLKKENLKIQLKQADCSVEKCPSLSAVIKESKKALKNSEVGTSKSARAFLKVLKAVKRASTEEIYNALVAKDAKTTLLQLMDILGAVQTPASHQAALRKLRINTDDFDLDTSERYLWALSMSPNPQTFIVNDLLNILKNEQHKEPKMWETLVLTLSAMVKRLGDETITTETSVLLERKLSECTEVDEKCRQIYLKSLANLRSPRTIPTLLNFAVNSTKKTGAAAMYAMKRLGEAHWDLEVLKVAERVLLSNTSDSSARTLAADILLEMKPSGRTLSRILTLLKNKETSKEVKAYLLQRINQISEDDPVFEVEVYEALLQNNLYHYDTLAPGGLSTAFTRRFMPEGTLSTTQEISGGLLKRGYVHINLDSVPESLFTLGIFSGGLSSFASSDSTEEADDEEATAGLELTVLGVEMRPFVFFTGQGELMGHVFSGTGSDLTPAYQAILLVDDQRLEIPLVTGGVVAEINFKTAASVDLSGKIEVSLWYKNAKSLVQNVAGIVSYGEVKLNSDFVTVQTDYTLTAEPKLDLASDIQFSEGVALCLQLKQPTTEISCKVNKLEKIHGSKHKLTRVSVQNIPAPGKTYFLNSKNNEMCNVILGG